jgi:hypothetical protein
VELGKKREKDKPTDEGTRLTRRMSFRLRFTTQQIEKRETESCSTGKHSTKSMTTRGKRARTQQFSHHQSSQLLRSLKNMTWCKESADEANDNIVQDCFLNNAAVKNGFTAKSEHIMQIIQQGHLCVTHLFTVICNYVTNNFNVFSFVTQTVCFRLS